MTKARELFPSSSSPSPSKLLGIGHQSQVITKLKPKIRVIHVDAPKIIQTDAANFRDLVQRLTGNKPEDKNGRTTEKQEEQDFLGLRNGKKKRIKNEEDEEDHDDDDEILMRRSKSNEESFRGFFDHHHQHGFSEFDGFMEQLSTIN